MNNPEICQPAGNAPGSVAKTSLETAEWKLLPHIKSQIWNQTIFPYLDRLTTSNQPIHLLDLGCGLGAHLETLCRYIITNKGHVIPHGVDLIPQNTHITRTRLLSLGISHPDITTLDLRHQFPLGKHHLVIAAELIHWFSPQENTQLLQNIFSSLHPRGLAVLSYATPLNNANLATPHGLDISRRHANHFPIYRYSHATDSFMTFYNKASIFTLAQQTGFQILTYTEARNFFFPTCPFFGIPFNPTPDPNQPESAENAYLVLQKPLSQK